MRKISLCLLGLALVALSFTNSDLSSNSPNKVSADNSRYFSDKDWQTIVKINEYYLEGIVKSKMKLESVDELTPENIAKNLNITLEKYNRDVRLAKEAGIRLKSKLEKEGVGCKDCGISSNESTANMLKALQKMRQNEKFMKAFFKSIEGVNLGIDAAENEPGEPQEPGGDGCPQPISFLGCTAACSALGPVLGTICAAGCWCTFCRPGQC